MNIFKKITTGRLRWVTAIAVAAVLAVALSGAYIFATSPGPIRNPKIEHAHVRVQLVVDGEAVNFGDQKYQETYDQSSCSADLPESPIHFHDNIDQFLHLHWKDMTGGMFLKYYGWNMIGGQNGLLGYRFDELPEIKSVKTYGNVLPELNKDNKLWVYTGDENDYKERSTDDFLKKDFETFFGKKSLINNEEVSVLDWLFPPAYAHGSDHSSETSSGEKTDEELQRINNMLGNVVIFAQSDKPSDQQVKDKFNNLEPLVDSTCGG